MDEKKKALLAEIETRHKEVRRLGVKIDTMQEIICHLRFRISNNHKRVREIRSEIVALRHRVYALEQVGKN